MSNKIIKIEIKDGLFTLGRARTRQCYPDVQAFHNQLSLSHQDLKIFNDLLRDIGLILKVSIKFEGDSVQKEMFAKLADMYFGVLPRIPNPNSYMDEFYNEIINSLTTIDHTPGYEFITKKFKAYGDLIVYDRDND